MSERRPASKSAPGANDVLIVGAGLIGMTTAVALSRLGIACTIVDRAVIAASTAPERDGRTTAVALSGKRLFDAIGLWSTVAAEACPIHDIRVSDGESRLFLHYDHREVAETTGGEPMGFIVENADLLVALTEAVRRSDLITVRDGTVVEGIKNRPDRIRALIASEAGSNPEVGATTDRSIDARLLIAADGKFSRIRDFARIRTTRVPYDQTSIVCNAIHDVPHRNVAHERFLPGGPFAVLPMNHRRSEAGQAHGGRSSIVWSDRTPVARAMLALDDEAFSREMTARFGPALGRLRVDGRRWSYPLSLVQAERFTAPRIALVGDAAHGIHPIAGQGFNLGLRDIAVLVELLGEATRLGLDTGGATLLGRYERRRRPDAATLVLATHGFDALFSNDIAPLRIARRLGLAAVGRLPALKRRFMLEAMGLGGARGGDSDALPALLRGQLP